METVSFTYTYHVKCFVSEDICLTECGKYINVKKGIELKQFIRGGKRAIYIQGKAINVENLIPHNKNKECPF